MNIKQKKKGKIKYEPWKPWYCKRERERELQFKPQERNSILNIIELIDNIGRDRKIHLLFCVMQN